MKTPLLALSLALLFIPLSFIQANDIDWARAASLRAKAKRGQELTAEEDAYLKRAIAARSAPDPTRGDGSDEQATVPPIVIPEDTSPVRTLNVTASDGNTLQVVYRAPKADRPLPAIVFIHGSLGQSKPRELIQSALTNPTHTRFLSKGFVSVAATFRTYGEDPLSRGPILDAIAIVQAVKKLPEVDPGSVVVFGTSGGGSIALELAGEKDLGLPAVVVGEPASVLYTGLMTDLSMRDESMKNYAALYTDERRAATEKKIAAISCPILVHHGDVHLLRKINFEIVFPAIQAAGKTLLIKNYPGEDHGFYWGNRTSEATVNAVVANTLDFILPLLKSPPAG